MYIVGIQNWSSSQLSVPHTNVIFIVERTLPDVVLYDVQNTNVTWAGPPVPLITAIIPEPEQWLVEVLAL